MGLVGQVQGTGWDGTFSDAFLSPVTGTTGRRAASRVLTSGLSLTPVSQNCCVQCFTCSESWEQKYTRTTTASQSLLDQYLLSCACPIPTPPSVAPGPEEGPVLSGVRSGEHGNSVVSVGKPG